MFDEWNERLLFGGIEEKEDGSLEIHLEDVNCIAKFRGLSKLFEDAQIDAYEYWREEEEYDWRSESYHYLIKNGKEELLDQNAAKGKCK